jgi:hypothetical protein
LKVHERDEKVITNPDDVHGVLEVKRANSALDVGIAED